MSTPGSKGASSPAPWRVADGGDVVDATGQILIYSHECLPEDAALIAAAPEMAAVLRQLEWAAWEHADVCCPSCKNYRETVGQSKGGHAPGCPLDALLTKVAR